MALLRKRRREASAAHIRALEQENEELDREIAAIDALPPEISADGVDQAELSAYEGCQTVQRIIDERAAREAREHPLSHGRQKPPRNVPVLDDAYFMQKRASERQLIGFGMSASQMARSMQLMYAPTAGVHYYGGGSGGYYGGHGTWNAYP